MFKLIYRKRSSLKNWKIKKYHLNGGDVKYSVWYKSIFGWWRSERTPSQFPDGWSERTFFDTEEGAKGCVKENIIWNQREYDSTINKVEEIRF